VDYRRRQGAGVVSHAKVGQRPKTRRPLNRTGRSIICDGFKPECKQCSESNRKCQWSGLRLSWPRNNDRRRFIVSNSQSPCSSSPTSAQASDAQFVHTSNWDMELFHHLTSSVPIRALSLLDEPMSWNLSTVDMVDRDLLRYCMLCNSYIATYLAQSKGIEC
jgi:hypothetical protein